jgi:hypothetical protein
MSHLQQLFYGLLNFILEFLWIPIGCGDHYFSPSSSSMTCSNPLFSGIPIVASQTPYRVSQEAHVCPHDSSGDPGMASAWVIKHYVAHVTLPCLNMASMHLLEMIMGAPMTYLLESLIDLLCL